MSSSEKDDSFLYYYPTNSEFSFLSRTTQKINEKGELKISLDLKKAGFVYIFPQIDHKENGWHAIQLYVEPNSNISIRFDKSDPKNTIQFTGKNKAIQEFMNARKRHFLLYFSNQDESRKNYIQNSPELSFNHLDSLKNTELSELKNIQNISQEAHSFITADINCYYTEAFYALLLTYGFSENNGEWVVKDEWIKTAMDNIVDKKTDKYSCASLWYESSLALKRGTISQIQKPKLDSLLKGYQDFEKDWELSSLIFTDQELRIYTSIQLYHNMYKNQFSQSTLYKYKKYKHRFQNSPFFAKLSKPFEDQLSFQSSSNNRLSIDTNDYKSIQELCEGQNIDYIFVDLWATWCRPCIKEFGKSDSLKQFINNNSSKIRMVYVSFDEHKTSTEIEDVINYHKLHGTHIIANQDLREEFKLKFGENNTISIPKYLLFSKQGDKLISNASPPSQWKKLKSEIESFIN